MPEVQALRLRKPRLRAKFTTVPTTTAPWDSEQRGEPLTEAVTFHKY